MSNIVPQPQITFENNKIYVDSPVDVKYTLDGLDPVFYGLIYTSPISISHTTTIKAISVNSLGEFSNLVAGTFTPESDVSDGSSNSSWIPVTYTYILNPSPGGGADLSNYTTYSYVNSYYTSYSYINANYTTFSYLEDKNYATEQYVSDAIGSIEFPEPDLSSYVTKTELSSQSYLTSIPSEYITQTELSNCSYITMNDITIPVIDESIIPNTTATYTLGDASHFYNAAYSKAFYTRISNLTGFENNGNYTGIYVRVGGINKLDINSNDMRPVSNGNYNLGTNNAKFGTTYTANLYADNIHNFIWTGTSAEYAALDNYTTYQIYMIKES